MPPVAIVRVPLIVAKVPPPVTRNVLIDATPVCVAAALMSTSVPALNAFVVKLESPVTAPAAVPFPALTAHVPPHVAYPPRIVEPALAFTTEMNPEHTWL